MLFSLFSWPSDGEPSLFRVFAAELNPTVLDVLESSTNKNRKCKIHYIRSHSLLSSSLTQLCDAAVFGPHGMRSSFAIRKVCARILYFFWKSFSWKEEKKSYTKVVVRRTENLSNHGFCHDQEKCSPGLSRDRKYRKSNSVLHLKLLKFIIREEIKILLQMYKL